MRSERGSSPYSPTGLRSEAAGGVTTREVINAIVFKFQTGTQWIHPAGEV